MIGRCCGEGCRRRRLRRRHRWCQRSLRSLWDSVKANRFKVYQFINPALNTFSFFFFVITFLYDFNLVSVLLLLSIQFELLSLMHLWNLIKLKIVHPAGRNESYFAYLYKAFVGKLCCILFFFLDDFKFLIFISNFSYKYNIL